MAPLHQITGYDQKTNRFVLGHDIPGALLGEVKAIVETGPDDPDAIEVYLLTPDQAARIQSLIKCPEIILPAVNYYLEAYLPVNPADRIKPC